MRFRQEAGSENKLGDRNHELSESVLRRTQVVPEFVRARNAPHNRCGSPCLPNLLPSLRRSADLFPRRSMNEIRTSSASSPVDDPSVQTPSPSAALSKVRSTHQSSSAAWLFPGLGCRYVGMGHDVIGCSAVADLLISQAESYLGYDLATVCLSGSGRKHVPARQEAQVIYVLDCAYAAVLRADGYTPRIVAGHSLGSLAAGCVSGAFDFLTGLQLVTHVEELMEELIDGRGLGMGVIIGLDGARVGDLLAAHPAISQANWNSPLQHVIAGPVAELDQVLATAAAQGAKQAKRFASERAMHTPYVAEAAERFRQRLLTVDWAEPSVPLMDSHAAAVLRTADEIRQFLGGFLAQPVCWQATVQALLANWGSQFVEVGPGNVLSSMLPFIDRTAAVQTASEVREQASQRSAVGPVESGSRN